MLLEALHTTQLVLATSHDTAVVVTRAANAVSSPLMSTGEGAPASTESDPSRTGRLSACTAVVSAIAAWVTLGVALLAVLYAARQVKEARDQVEETRSTRRERVQPHVVMFAELATLDAYVFEAGGHDAAAPRGLELVEACAGGDLAAGLLTRLLRGDLLVKPALGSRLQQRQATTPSRTARPSAARIPAAKSPAGIPSSGKR